MEVDLLDPTENSEGNESNNESVENEESVEYEKNNRKWKVRIPRVFYKIFVSIGRLL